MSDSPVFTRNVGTDGADGTTPWVSATGGINYASGNVGVANATPAKPLDVTGDIRTSTGILFGADTAAANTLDDYEEGVWTPALEAASGVVTSYSIRNGSYTKIGNIVHARFYIDVSNKGTLSGDLKITGLPFTPNAVGAVVSFNAFGVYSTVFTSPMGYPTTSGSKINLNIIRASATSTSPLTASDVSTAGPDFWGMAVYEV